MTIITYFKGKGIGRGKGSDQAAAKGKGSVKDGCRGSQFQDCQAMYLGDEGHTVCTLAFGGGVARIPKAVVGKLVDVKGLEPRTGQVGVLYCSENRGDPEARAPPVIFWHHLPIPLAARTDRLGHMIVHPGIGSRRLRQPRNAGAGCGAERNRRQGRASPRGFRIGHGREAGRPASPMAV